MLTGTDPKTQNSHFDLTNNPLVRCYAPLQVAFERGHGSCLYDVEGKRYLDFGSGIASCSLGHCNPVVVNAINNQAKKLMHVSNLYVIKEAWELARMYIEACFAERVFFCNSGAEAVETGIKMARAYQHGIGQAQRKRIISFNHAFHGRTVAAASAAGKMGGGLEPPFLGFDIVDTNIDAVKRVLSKETAAILIEPIQGEGGINVMSESFLTDLRNLCNENGVLLFLDCVQCGSGRTGKLFAYQHTQIEPDICSIAKGMGGGFPIGACLAKAEVADHLKLGMHGTTFGGNPLATSVGAAVFREISAPGFLAAVTEKGEYAKKKLEETLLPTGQIEGIVGKGLMIGLRMKSELGQNSNPRTIIDQLAQRGLLCVIAAQNTLRVLPPLTISTAEIDEGCGILGDYFGNL